MAQTKRVGYAVVGLGHISERAVLPAFRHAKKSRLIALVSGDAKKAKRLAAKFHAPAYFTYDQYEECLQNPEVEAVYIATNNSTHPDFTVRAAAAGKHVLCEKPLANTVGECRQMVEACRKNNVKLMTAYRKYFEPATIDLKKLIGSGKLGRLKLIHSAFTFNLPKQQVWHLSRELSGGGSLLDVGVYCVNTIRWLTGMEPAAAAAYSWTTDPDRFKEVEESISFQLKFPDGLYVQASSSFAAEKASFLQIHAEKGWAALNPAYAYNEERRLFGQIGAKWFGKVYKAVEEFHLELDHLAGCILAKRDPEPDGVTGLRDVAIMQAIYEAARLDRPVLIQLPM
jgi:predicted dehydrogenase